jgi:hypothetical protein
MGILKEKRFEVLVASDVATRDGIGIELYENGEMILEVFRDDTRKTREITLYKRDVPVELVEEALEVFRKEIPRDFQE